MNINRPMEIRVVRVVFKGIKPYSRPVARTRDDCSEKFVSSMPPHVTGLLKRESILL